MPKVSLLKRTNLQDDSWHSMLISLFRGAAALVVAWAHLRAAMYPAYGDVADPSLPFQALAFSSGFAYLAVMVFFVLSGWLVGGSFLNKVDTQHAIRHYAIDRVSRLWVVLLPTFLVTLLAGAVAGAIDPARASFAVDEPYSATAFIGNMVGLQTLVVPSFGDNFPLWSLANETWYYVLFPLLVLPFRAGSIAVRAGALLAIATIVHLLTGGIVLYFSIWLLGAALSRVKIEAGLVLRGTLLLLVAGAGILIRLVGDNDISQRSYPQFLAFSVLFGLFLCSMQTKRPASPMLERIDRGGRFFANFSFTLYVLHVPLIVVLQHVNASLFGLALLSPAIGVHYLVYLAMFTLLVVAGYLFYLPFEANTGRVRHWMKAQLAPRGGAVRT